MTTRLRRSGRVYRLDGRRVPSVTTVTGVLDKPALIDWAAKQSATYAVEHWEELAELGVVERAERIARARWETTKAAADRGTTLHKMAEQLHTGEARPPAELLGPVEAIARFLDTWELTTTASEAPVASVTHQYAGTLDTVATSPKLGTILLDWKSGGRIYSETTLQLAAYRSCELMHRPRIVTGPRGGKRLEHDETVMPAIDACYVAHILSDDVRLVPVRAGDDDLQAFLYARELWEWRRSVADLTAETFDPPLGEPLDPDAFADFPQP